MTAFEIPAGRLLTVAEYMALPEQDERYELQGGSLVMSPSPAPRHQHCMTMVVEQLRPQVPEALLVLADVDVDLQLAPPEGPGFVRAPDVVVASWEGVRRLDREHGPLRASEIVLAVEILSPSTLRIDRALKRSEYADAGIPHYWMIDLDPRPTLTACHLAGEFGYVDAPQVTGTFTADAPFPLSLGLDALRL